MLNRNLETADAVAATGIAASRACARSIRRRPSRCCCRCVGGDQMLHNALMADADGRLVAWARPPDRDGRRARSIRRGCRSVADDRQDVDQPDARQAGDAAHAIVLGYPIVDDDGWPGRRARPVGAPRGARAGPGVDSAAAWSVVTLTDENSVVVARSLDASQYVGRSDRAPGGSRAIPSTCRPRSS